MKGNRVSIAQHIGGRMLLQSPEWAVRFGHVFSQALDVMKQVKTRELRAIAQAESGGSIDTELKIPEPHVTSELASELRTRRRAVVALKSGRAHHYVELIEPALEVIGRYVPEKFVTELRQLSSS